MSGGDIGGSKQWEAFLTQKEQMAQAYGLTGLEGRKLAKMYGTNVDKVFQYAQILSTIPSSLPLAILAQIYYAVHEEMAYSPVDFLVRRTGMLYFDIQHFSEYKEEIVNVMKHLLHYSDEESIAFNKQLETLFNEATLTESRD